MDVGTEAKILMLFLLRVQFVVNASRYIEFCRFFNGTCEPSCGPEAITLPGTTWCSFGQCCRKATKPSPSTAAPSPSTTTTVTTPSPIPACGIKGRARLNGRIIGGEPAAKCEFPWMVLIALEFNNPCGGALVDDRHIITAAHCFGGSTRDKHSITIGEYKTTEKAPAEKFTTTDYRIFKHPDYSSSTFFNDITLLRLNTAINFSMYTCIQPLCLPAANQQFPEGTECLVTGWGVTEPVYDFTNPPIPQVLMKVPIPVVDETICEDKFGSFYNRTIETCAGQMEGGKDSCDGDSGGPLMCRAGSGSEYYAVGVVSSGIGCARPQTPAIYTDIVAHLPWIQSIIDAAD